MCIVLNCRSGTRYFCRNYDRERSHAEKVVISPRNQVFRFLNGKVLENHYWIAGTGAAQSGYPLFFEACNEKGLCMAAVDFSDYAEYSKEETGEFIATHEMIPWVLAQCSDLDEARALLSRTKVIERPFSNKIPSYPLHWMVSDDTGSIIVEPLYGFLVVRDNPAEVMTNGPPLPFHLDNLEHYMHLTRRSPRNLLPEELKKSVRSKGMGAIGLPGDYSSASRFVRGCFVKFNSIPESDSEIDVERMFRILESVSIPKGCVEVSNGIYEYTRYSVCIDPVGGRIYYRCRENSQICMVDVHRTDVDGSEIVAFELIAVPQFLYQNRGRG